jgi:hypothetical protein
LEVFWLKKWCPWQDGAFRNKIVISSAVAIIGLLGSPIELPSEATFRKPMIKAVPFGFVVPY